MNDNLIVKYIISILDIIDKKWEHESIFNYMKNPLSGFNTNDIFQLEKICYKMGNKRQKMARNLEI